MRQITLPGLLAASLLGCESANQSADQDPGNVPGGSPVHAHLAPNAQSKDGAVDLWITLVRPEEGDPSPRPVTYEWSGEPGKWKKDIKQLDNEPSSVSHGSMYSFTVATSSRGHVTVRIKNKNDGSYDYETLTLNGRTESHADHDQAPTQGGNLVIRPPMGGHGDQVRLDLTGMASDEGAKLFFSEDGKTFTTTTRYLTNLPQAPRGGQAYDVTIVNADRIDQPLWVAVVPTERPHDREVFPMLIKRGGSPVHAKVNPAAAAVDEDIEFEHTQPGTTLEIRYSEDGGQTWAERTNWLKDAPTGEFDGNPTTATVITKQRHTLLVRIIDPTHANVACEHRIELNP